MEKPVVFLSYSPVDKNEKEDLLLHLKIVQENYSFELWNDKDQIKPGVVIQDKIDQAINSASIALLLITANYLNSDEFAKVAPSLRRRQEEGGLTVIPIIARQCPWRTIKWLDRLSALPWDRQPIWGNNTSLDDRLTSIALEVGQMAASKVQVPLTPRDSQDVSSPQTEEAISILSTPLIGLSKFKELLHILPRWLIVVSFIVVLLLTAVYFGWQRFSGSGQFSNATSTIDLYDQTSNLPEPDAIATQVSATSEVTLTPQPIPPISSPSPLPSSTLTSTPIIELKQPMETSLLPATSTLTPTLTSSPNTSTPSPFPTPTASPSPTETPTLTPSFTPSPSNTRIPDPATPILPANSPTPTEIVPAAAPIGQFILLRPTSTSEATNGLTVFEWQYSGLSDNQGFEVRVWRDGEAQAGVHDAILDNKQGNIQVLGNNTYRLEADISQISDIRRPNGEYNWTVLLIEIEPYKELGKEATPARLRYEAVSHDSGGGGGTKGGGGG